MRGANHVSWPYSTSRHALLKALSSPGLSCLCRELLLLGTKLPLKPPLPTRPPLPQELRLPPSTLELELIDDTYQPPRTTHVIDPSPGQTHTRAVASCPPPHTRNPSLAQPALAVRPPPRRTGTRPEAVVPGLPSHTLPRSSSRKARPGLSPPKCPRKPSSNGGRFHTGRVSSTPMTLLPI